MIIFFTRLFRRGRIILDKHPLAIFLLAPILDRLKLPHDSGISFESVITYLPRNLWFASNQVGADLPCLLFNIFDQISSDLIQLYQSWVLLYLFRIIVD